MGGAAAVVDVHAVRLSVDEICVQGQAVKQIRRCGRGRAVGAVHQHPQARQVAVDAGNQMVDVIPLHLPHPVKALADLAVGLDVHGSAAEDQLLHTGLTLVGKLIAPSVEHLDAVVLIGVVGCRDDDARIRLLQHRQIRHRRCGNGAKGHHVTAHRADARHQRRLQHIRGDTGVLADGNGGLAPLLLRQDGSHCLPHMKSQFYGEIFTNDTTDAIRAKQFAHKRFLLLLISPAVPVLKTLCAGAHMPSG